QLARGYPGPGFGRVREPAEPLRFQVLLSGSVEGVDLRSERLEIPERALVLEVTQAIGHSPRTRFDREHRVGVTVDRVASSILSSQLLMEPDAHVRCQIRGPMRVRALVN